MRKTLLSLPLIACLVAALLPSTVKAQPYYEDAVAVLMYHHVHDLDRSSSTIPTQLLYKQLYNLQMQGFHFISMEQFRQFLQGQSLPSNAVLVTFDDGYESFYSHAYPILRKLSIPSINFLITKHLTGKHQTYVAPMNSFHLRQIRQYQTTNAPVELQCHTHNMHHYRGKTPMLMHITKANQQYLMDDLATNIQLLLPYNNQPVDSLSYPFGQYNPGTLHAVQESGIRYAFTIREGLVTRTSPRLMIPRINAGSPDIDATDLVRKLKKLALAHKKTPA